MRRAMLALHRAVLSQSTHVAFPFTVGEVVRMGAGDRGGRAIDDARRARRSPTSISRHFSERIITTLSGGEQQRAHFARVLVQLACGEAAHGPGLLLLDEPTASLDLRHQLDMLEAVGRCARRGVAVVAILHDLNLATLLRRPHRGARRGRVAADGAPAETVTDDCWRGCSRSARPRSRARRPPACRSCCRTGSRRCARQGRVLQVRGISCGIDSGAAACSHRSNSGTCQENNP